MWQTVKTQPLPILMRLPAMLALVPVKKAIDVPTRRRVAAHVRRYLARKNMTKEQLEAKLELGSGTISRVLSGRSLGLDVVLKINRILGIDAEELLNQDPRPYKPSSS